jgi:hypothetical protein
MSVSTSPEWAVVLDGMRAALGSTKDPGHAAASSAAAVDWSRVLEIARQHSIAPLLHRGLRRMAKQLPNAVSAALKQEYVRNAARNALLFRLLEGLLRSLASANVPVVALKGVYLAELAYAERALRPMSDIDLLVREEHLDRAAAALEAVGYRIAHDPEAREDLRTRHHHWIFRRDVRGGGIPVEVHWDLHPPGTRFRMEARALWDRAVPVSLAGVPALSLGPDDLLLHLVSHAARHRFKMGLLPICDVAALLESCRDSLSGEELAARASESGCAGPTKVMLEIATDLLGTEAPAGALAALETNGDQDLDARQVRERILEERGELRGAAEFRIRWQARDWRQRLSAVQHVLAGALRDGDPAGRRPLSAVLLVAGRYARWTWSLLSRRGRVAAIAGREAAKSRLDAWYAPAPKRGAPAPDGELRRDRVRST